MRPVEKWIWLPCELYPKAQTTRYSWHVRTRTEENYAVAQFDRVYESSLQRRYRICALLQRDTFGQWPGVARRRFFESVQ